MEALDIFNVSDDFAKEQVQENEKSGDGLYRIDLKKAKDGVWKGRLRLLPNIDNEGKVDPENPYWIKKIMQYVKVPLPGHSGYYDSPKTVNEKCELSDTYWALKNNDDPLMQERASMLNYVVRYFAYVQVIQDPQNPENEGKIMIWSFGNKIYAKIKDMHEGSLTGEVENVADLGQGHDLILNVKEVGGYTNYDSCQFDTARTPIKVPSPKDPTKLVPVPVEDNGNGKMVVQEKGKKAVLDMLTSKEVDVSEYKYQPYDAATQAKVKAIISFLTNVDSNTATTAASGGGNTAASSFNADEFFSDDSGSDAASESEASDFDSAFD